jgi:hypothetical protein
MSSTIREMVGFEETGGGGEGVDLWASVAVAIHLAALGDHELWGIRTWVF